MKAELQKELFDRYPKLFVEKDLPMSQSCMYWGIDCGDGWYGLLNKLCTQLVWLNENASADAIVTQVKEKFGTLRFYYRGGDVLDLTEACVHKAECQSAYTCETCGKYGELNKGPWYSVRCTKCRGTEI